MESLNKKNVYFDENEEPIVISKYTLDLLLAQPNGSNLIVLYIFYYYTAKWQKTNQVKATNSYVANGLQWGVDKVVKYKNQLRALNLINNIIQKNTNGKIIGHYIKVNFIWTKEKLNRITTNVIPNSMAQSTIQGVLPCMVKSDPNALSVSNINALSVNRGVNDRFLNYFPTNYQENKNFQTAINEFIIHRKEKGKTLTELSCKKLANRLITFPIPICIEALNASVENGWTGVFPESIQQKQKDSPNFKRSQFKPEYKYNGTIRYTLNPNDGEYYHKNGDKYID